MNATIGADGTITGLVLVPNDVITPSGTYYTVRFTGTAPVSGSWTQLWRVTTSPDPVNVGAVTRLDTPTGLMAMAIQEANVTKVENPNILDFTDCTVTPNGNEAQISCPGAGGAPPFNAVTGGTNTTAAMLVGTGASLGTSDSGTIAATTAAALAANGGNCSAGQFPLGVNAAGVVESCTQPSFAGLTGTASDAQVPNNITIDLAAAATALAANGSNCSGNNFALGVDASGVGECAQPAFSNLSGSATDAQVPDTITVSLAATATALAANGGNCSGNNFALGVDASGVGECAQPAFSNLSGSATDAQIPNTITIDLAAAATALAANPADCSANQYATTIAASGALTCASIAAADLPTGFIDAAGDFNASLCTSDQIIKKVSGTWACAADGGGAGTSPFTDADPIAMTTTTRDVQIGAALTNSAKLSVDGDADQVQLSVQGHSTQTTTPNLVVIENSAGSDLFIVNNSGNATASGTVTANSIDTADQATSPGNRMRLRDNDVDLSPNPSCSDCPAGELCIVDIDDTSPDVWMICDGTTPRLRIDDAATGTAATLDGGQLYSNAFLDDDGVTFQEASTPTAGMLMDVDLLTDFRAISWPDFDMVPLSTAVQQTVSSKYLRDTTVLFQNNADASKFLKFDLNGLSASSTRTVSWPDSDFTPVGTTLTQTLTNKSHSDSTTNFIDNLDNTKMLRFQISGISASTTRTATWPDADLTVVGTALTQTLTNKTIDAEGTGNDLTTVSKVFFPAATCQNATATANFDTPTSNAAAAACITGTNTQKGVLDFDQTTDESVQGSVMLPSDWTGAIDVKYIWLANTTDTGLDVTWCFQTVCSADAESDDLAFTAQSSTTCVTDAAKGTANQLNVATDTGVTAGTGTPGTCAAGELMHFLISRDPNETAGLADDLTMDARLVGVELTLRRTQ